MCVFVFAFVNLADGSRSPCLFAFKALILDFFPPNLRPDGKCTFPPDGSNVTDPANVPPLRFSMSRVTCSAITVRVDIAKVSDKIIEDLLIVCMNIYALICVYFFVEIMLICYMKIIIWCFRGGKVVTYRQLFIADL